MNTVNMREHLERFEHFRTLERVNTQKNRPPNRQPIHLILTKNRAYFFWNFNAPEFMQYRRPVGLGPSSKTCPRCP